jgi:uncharacterized protein
MVIDCHTHLGRNEHINCTVKQLLNSMDQSGIDKALVFAGELNDCPNSYLLKELAPHKDRLYGVAAWHPNFNSYDVDMLKGMVDNKEVVAVKFYLGYDHWYPNDKEIYKVLDTLQGKNITAIFHCGDCLNTVKGAKLKYAHPLGIDEVAVDYPDQKIVMAHMAYPWHRDAAEVCYKNANVYSDISGFVYGDFSILDKVKFQQTINEFMFIAGSEKLLFGTDWPISNQDSYVKVLDAIYGQQHDAESLSKNIVKVFNL